MRVRVSKFEYVVKTRRVGVNTLLERVCNIIYLHLSVKKLIQFSSNNI